MSITIYPFMVNRYKVCICIFLCAVLILPGIASATEKTAQSYNLVQSAPVPGYVLLGHESATVERPGSVTDLILSVQNQSEDFSVLPQNYAVALAPYWLFYGAHITYEQYIDGHNLMTNALQTLSLSVATVSTTSDTTVGIPRDMTSLGFGLRFSLLRGEVDPAFQNHADRLDSIHTIAHTLNNKIADETMKRMRDDAVLNGFDSVFRSVSGNSRQLLMPMITTLQSQREAEIKREVEKEIREQYETELVSISELVSKLRMRRTGWKLAFAGGASIDFPTRSFDNGKWKNLGMWITGGYEHINWSVLGLVRIINDLQGADLSCFDIGGRFMVDNVRMMSLSVESVYRRFYEGNNPHSTMRLAWLLDYPLGKNKLITLTFGRDFEGNRSRNLISAVNLVIGFGSDRPI